MRIVGIERVFYTNKLGQNVDGYRLHMGIPLPDTDKNGYPVTQKGLSTMRWNSLNKRFESINYFIQRNVFDNFIKPYYDIDEVLFNSDVECTFNEYGQIATIQFI